MNFKITKAALTKKVIYYRACFWSDCFQSPNAAVWHSEKHNAVMSLCMLGDRRKVLNMAEFYKRLSHDDHGMDAPSRIIVASSNKVAAKNKIPKPNPTHYFFLAIWYLPKDE